MKAGFGDQNQSSIPMSGLFNLLMFWSSHAWRTSKKYGVFVKCSKKYVENQKLPLKRIKWMVETKMP